MGQSGSQCRTEPAIATRQRSVLKVDAPVQARVDGDQLRFDPIPQMDGRASQKFRVEVRHGKVGTQKVSAQLRSQNRPTLVIKEEATEVYNDRE